MALVTLRAKRFLAEHFLLSEMISGTGCESGPRDDAVLSRITLKNCVNGFALRISSACEVVEDGNECFLQSYFSFCFY